MKSARAETVVLSSGGLKSVLLELRPRLERRLGRKLDLRFGPANLLKDQIDRGQPFDLAILTRPLLDALVRERKIVSGSVAPIARAGVGLAVRSGAGKPEIATVEQFRQALLDAKSIVYTTAGQSGLHFAAVIDKLGIAEAVKARARTLPGGAAAELVANGEAELAVQLIPELKAVSGVTVVGPFPPELQNYVVLTAGVGAHARHAAAARAVIKLLSSSEAISVITARGMEPI